MSGNKIAPIIEKKPDMDVRDLTSEEVDQLEIREAELSQRYGDGKEFNRQRVEGELIVLANQVRNTYLQMGKKLIFLKKHGDHGQFLESLQRIDIHPRTAQNLMKVAKAFIDELGEIKYETVSHLPPLKLLALARLDDEELAELEDTGEVAGFTREEIEGMKAKEFEARIRELKSENRHLREQIDTDAEIHNQILAEKNRRIDDLDAKLRITNDPARWQEKAEMALDDLQKMVPLVCSQMAKFSEIVDWTIRMEPASWENSQMILLEQCRHTLDDIEVYIESIGKQLDNTIPHLNSVFHSVTTLRSSFVDGSKSPEAEG